MAAAASTHQVHHIIDTPPPPPRLAASDQLQPAGQLRPHHFCQHTPLLSISTMQPTVTLHTTQDPDSPRKVQVGYDTALDAALHPSPPPPQQLHPCHE
jgi:hypothetical protein